ncbi:alpha-galactosidase [Frondihabitans sp. PAMC 28766]|nr:alpha-galactosidase [Frondihabitans sp. PAMC 28766]
MAISVPFIHLRRSGVSVVLAVNDGRLPRILHWGADLGDLSPEDLAAVSATAKPPMAHNPNDQAWDISLLPEYEAGWVGRPGIDGSRAGRDWSPSLAAGPASLAQDVTSDDGRLCDRVACTAADAVAQLMITLEIELLESGLLRARATLKNDGDTYQLQALRLAFPVPTEAGELLDFTGRHMREHSAQRSPFTVGVHSREQRGGRTGLDAAYLLIAGVAGFGYRGGQVWATHLAFSGNQNLYAERIYNGARVIGGSELLQSGEVVLTTGEAYTSPWFLGSYADGLDAMSARFHEHVRTGRAYPRSPRPVVINTWEAVYFKQDLAVLTELADHAAELGVERFVLDDGWFGSRRDDSSGLGDWTVSKQVWPNGLGPLIDHVKSLGLDFGLWVEPEMVNRDSDLAREHPEWLFEAGGRHGYSSRRQHVLDLTHPEAYDYIFAALNDLLTRYDIAALKWDHNRQLVEAGHQPDGRPAIHKQNLAVYRLMDELRSAHPGLELESCASGGGRVDLGILDHAQRVWGSDTVDPLERRRMHRETTLVVPPELIGSHVGSSPSHTTGRQHSLDFRAQTSMWNHFGLELDVRTLDLGDTALLAEWIQFYKANRLLLHTGTVVNSDHPDEGLRISGVVSRDLEKGLFSVTAMSRSVTWPPGRVALPGLDPKRVYAVSVPFQNRLGEVSDSQPDWMRDSLTMSGRVLGSAGLQLPTLRPEQSFLLRVTSI